MLRGGFEKPWELLLWGGLEAGRERKCEGDGSRAALPLSLPLVAL